MSGDAGQHRIAAFEQQALLLLWRQHAVGALVHPGILPLALRLVEDQRRGDGDVQRLHHADHRDNDVLIGQRQRFLGDAGFLLAHQDAGWTRIVDFTKIDGFVGKVSGENLHALAFQVADGICDSAVGFNLHPAVAARGGGGHGTHPAARPDGMHFVYANGICGPDDRRDVMRLMDLLHADRQVRLTPGEHLADTLVAL